MGRSHGPAWHAASSALPPASNFNRGSGHGIESQGGRWQVRPCYVEQPVIRLVRKGVQCQLIHEFWARQQNRIIRFTIILDRSQRLIWKTEIKYLMIYIVFEGLWWVIRFFYWGFCHLLFLFSWIPPSLALYPSSCFPWRVPVQCTPS